MKTRLSLRRLLDFIDEPNRSACIRMYEENEVLFRSAWGSVHNHQAWPGGYHDHLEEAGNFGVHLYNMAESTNRELGFTLSDVQLVLWLHDIEKPWKYWVTPEGIREIIPELQSKDAQHDFRFRKIDEYGIILESKHINGMHYVEGERDYEYSSYERKSWPLAGLCHTADHFSARVFPDYPLEENDPWIGARRAATAT